MATVAARTIVPDVAPAFIVKPSLSIASHFRTLKSLRFIEPDEPSPLDEPLEKDASTDWGTTESIVAAVDKNWLIPLEGAEASLQSRNPDRVRHIATSLRELLTAILHTLAPDDKVREALPDTRWHHEGRPTRRARIYYLLDRKYQSTALLDFIEKDVESTLELFTLLQQGTHEIVTAIKPEDLRFIVARTKILIGQLVQKPKSVAS